MTDVLMSIWWLAFCDENDYDYHCLDNIDIERWKELMEEYSIWKLEKQFERRLSNEQ